MTSLLSSFTRLSCRFLTLVSWDGTGWPHDTKPGFPEEGLWAWQAVRGFWTIQSCSKCRTTSWIQELVTPVCVHHPLAVCEIRLQGLLLPCLFWLKSPYSLSNIFLVFSSSITNLFRYRNQDHPYFFPVWMHQGFEEDRIIFLFCL